MKNRLPRPARRARLVAGRPSAAVPSGSRQTVNAIFENERYDPSLPLAFAIAPGSSPCASRTSSRPTPNRPRRREPPE